MKFRIRRTSLCDTSCPIDGCVWERYDRIEVRTLNSFEAFDMKFGNREGTWLSKGINHHINDRGFIQRTHPNENEGWFMEVSTLDELLKFIKNVKEDVVISMKDVPTIEIYDDYRE